MNDMNDMKEKALLCAKFYTELAENDNGFIYEGIHYSYSACGPRVSEKIEYVKLYKANPPKPKNEIINLNSMIDSDVDMEFYSEKFQWFIGKLTEIAGRVYKRKGGEYWENCRIRENHWHHVDPKNEKCPLPEGLVVGIELEGGTTATCDDYMSLQWSRSRDNYRITAFRVTGVRDGYKYAWDEE